VRDGEEDRARDERPRQIAEDRSHVASLC
jgi:hypothetical protein